jgi:homoserine kinase type II
MEFLSTFKSIFSTYAKQAGTRRFDRLFKDNTDRIFSVIDECLTANDRFQGMPVLPIHCDYHPGNLKFEKEKVVGIVDFDWSKIDYRLFDVALGLVYFASEWKGKAAGTLLPDKFELFLKSYNDTCRRLVYLEPLTLQEQKNLLPMLAAANLYVIHWDLADFYETPNPDDDEYYVFIDHNIRLMHWIEDQPAGIQTAIKKACA